MDVLLIQVSGVLQEEPIAGFYPIAPDGTVTLGLTYGSVRVVGLTLDEIKEAIEKQLKSKTFKEPQAVVTLGQSRALQQIAGEHLVRPDGTVGLGSYGTVAVAGMTLAEVKAAIESHLSQSLQKPEVAVDVLAYNSKVIYVIFDGGGSGEQVLRLPVTGNDTVLDALAQVGGLQAISSKHRIWVGASGTGVPHLATRSCRWTGPQSRDEAGRRRTTSSCPGTVSTWRPTCSWRSTFS